MQPLGQSLRIVLCAFVLLLLFASLGCSESSPSDATGTALAQRTAGLGSADAVRIATPRDGVVFDQTAGPVSVAVAVVAEACPPSDPAWRVRLFVNGAEAGDVAADGTATIADPGLGMWSLAAVCATADGTLLRETAATVVFSVTETCSWDGACVDDNPCSGSFCQVFDDGRRCTFGWPDPACCAHDFDCEGGLVCGADNRCVACVADGDCDDGDACTVDACVDGACVSAPAGECCAAADCDDGRACTVDRCVDGACVHEDAADPECCDGVDPMAECPGVDACTAAACVDNRCVYGAIGGPNCCVSSDEECDDGNPCTYDRCDAEVNLCVSEPDLSLEGCCTDALRDCDDGDPSTLEACVDAQCQNVPDPTWCDLERPCADDGNPCTVEYCLDNHCRVRHEDGCCRQDIDCVDGDPCTWGACVDGACTYEPIVGCCRDDVECDDGDPCTLDFCIGGLCKHGPDPTLPDCCDDAADCDDGNPCTVETCLSTHECSTQVTEVPGCCVTNFDCMPETGGGIGGAIPPTVWVCRHNTCVEEDNPMSCAANPTCDDGDPCTLDYCNEANQECRHYAQPSCCRSDAECRDDDPCTKDRCQDNMCVREPVATCCASDDACDDGDPCTEDYCVGGVCRSGAPREGCCRSDAACDDGDPCTVDVCELSTRTCAYVPSGLASCCYSDAECDDAITSTTDQCIDHRCENIPIPNFCTHDVQCEDGNPCTADRCVLRQCRFLPPGSAGAQGIPDACCVTDADCPADHDPCTETACVSGRCELAAVEPCARPLGFLEDFPAGALPAGWEHTIDPPDAGSGFEPARAGERAGDFARFLPDPQPERAYEGRLLTPWLQAENAVRATVQFDQRALGAAAPGASVVQVRVLPQAGAAWQTVWSRDLADVPSDSWELVTVDISALAGRARGRVAFVYRGLGTQAAGEWRLDWVAIDRGVPPRFRTAPVAAAASEGQVTTLPLVATDDDPWSESVWFHKAGLPTTATFADYGPLAAPELATLLGEPLPATFDAADPYTPWGWGYGVTLRVEPRLGADLGAYAGLVEARGAWLRDRQVAALTILPLDGCGDGELDPGEACDDGPYNSDRVADACRSDCQPARCGDGVRDAGEACDLGTTLSTGVPGAQVFCLPDCTLPSTCGDGVVDAGEGCDDGVNNSDLRAGACRSDCQPARCGDGVRDPGEACDLGPALSMGAPGASFPCDASCALTGTCGDGIVDANEGCDDGAFNSDVRPDACRTDCQPARCGDGVWDKGEECDLGLAITTLDPTIPLPCTDTCTVRDGGDGGGGSYCGDGIVDPGEGCDAGVNNSDVWADACRTDCQPARCGDAVRDSGEACDLGAAITVGAFRWLSPCRDDCTLRGDDGQAGDGDDRRCGDGVVDPGEGCDDGPLNSDVWPDACRTDCQPARCGDGVRDAGEECDLGYAVVLGDASAAFACRDDCTLRESGGGACVEDDDCADGFHCDEATGACVEDGGPGDGCASDDDCAEGFHCDEAAGACVEDGGTGDGCANDDDCAEGLHCDEATGACVEDGGTGDGCATDDDCADGLHCDAATGACAPADDGDGGGPGTRCTAHWDCAGGFHCHAVDLVCVEDGGGGDPCAADDDCRDGFHCDEATESCVEDGGTDDPCAADDDCRGGFHCDTDESCAPGGSDDDAPVVSVCGDGVVTAGETCDWGAMNSDVRPDACRSDCQWSRCGDGVRDTGEACDLGSMLALGDAAGGLPFCRDDCTLRSGDDTGDDGDDGGDGGDGDGGPGTRCTAHWDCLGGLHCHPVDLVCTEDGGDGDPCLDDAGCADGHHCDEATDACVPDGGSGDPCAAADDCRGGFHCDGASGTCEEDEGDGGSGTTCTIHWDCAGGFHCAPESGTCVEDGGDGDPCVADDACADGHHCDEAAGVCDEDGGTGDPCVEDGDCLVGFHCAATDATCAPDTPAVCGDGVIGAGELCDDGAANSDLVPDACRTDCRPARCGDGVLDGGEACDLGSALTLGDPTAPAPCDDDCTIAASCGDGVVDVNEACDDGAANDDTAPDACRGDCRTPRCGDGVVDSGEQCDPGTAFAAADAPEPGITECRGDCTWGWCGDGRLAATESCDHGARNSDVAPDACRTDCAPARCGDGVVDSGEQCDDGPDNGDLAVSRCTGDCQAKVEIVEWPREGSEITVGFEDLPVRKSDYDYNDWLSTFTVKGLYASGSPDACWGLEFTNRPRARGAGYDHAQHILLPRGLVRSSGSYVVRWYDAEGNFLREAAPVRFAADQPVDIVSFPHTKSALKSGTTFTNAVDCSGYAVGNEMRASVRFDEPVPFVLQDMTPEDIGPHGEKLFFDPYLFVHNTGEAIHVLDRRMVVVPETWRWPQERSPIWDAYPGCVHAGQPPTFEPLWYHCPFTDAVFEPECPDPVCGDGVVDEGEACDAGDANGDITLTDCTEACTLLERHAPAFGPVIFAVEDKTLGHSDWDYNDWVVSYDIRTLHDASGATVALEVTVAARARGEGFRHIQHVAFPPELVPADGAWSRRVYSNRGTLLGEELDVPFAEKTALDIVAIDDSKDVFDQRYTHVNVNDCTGFYRGDHAVVTLVFDRPVALDAADLKAHDVGLHGEGLPFDPWVEVARAGPNVPKASPHFITVPGAWFWPQEKEHIWEAYPECVLPPAGKFDPPTFTPGWYACPSTELVFEPYCYGDGGCDNFDGGAGGKKLCFDQQEGTTGLLTTPIRTTY